LCNLYSVRSNQEAIRNWAGVISGPIGVAEYRVLIADALPAALAEVLPTAAEIETGIGLTEGTSDDDANGSASL
jgi:hypothetical protein